MANKHDKFAKRFTPVKSWLAMAVVCSAVAFGAVPAANAQQATGAEEPITTSVIFSRICYNQVPSIEDIAAMALELAWQPLNDEELAPFSTQYSAQSLQGWDAQVGERVFRLGLTQGPIEGPLAATFPDFADGLVTSCTMVLDGIDNADQLYDEMRALAGKEPASKQIAEGELLTTTWAGGNDDVKVFLVMKSDANNAGTLLNVVVVTKS